MNDFNSYEDLEEKARLKEKKRQTKKSMKISGRSVFEIQKILKGKDNEEKKE